MTTVVMILMMMMMMFFLSDSGLTLNGMLIDSKLRPRRKGNQPENLFVGEVAVMVGQSFLHVTTGQIFIESTQATDWEDQALTWKTLEGHEFPITIKR